MTRFIVIALFLAIAVVLFFAQTKPYLNQITALKEEKETYSEALEHSRELQTLRDDLLSRYNSIPQESIDNLNKLLPSQIDSGSLIVMLEDITKKRGLLFKKIDISESKVSVMGDTASGIISASLLPYKTVNLSFAVSGPYSSFLGFLSDLERSLRVVDIDSLDFSAGPADFYEFSISAKIYAASPPPAFSFTVSGEEKGKEARQIVAMLAKLKSVKIDAGFFENETFKSFFDFTPPFEMPAEYGRPNPFMPLEASPKK